MSTQAPKFFSITFKVLDEAKFQELASRFTTEMANGHFVAAEGNHLLSNDDVRGYEVTACGWGDFASQADYYQEELENQGISPSDVILGCVERDYPDHTAEEVEVLVKGIIG